MTRTRKVLLVAALVPLAAAVALAIAISHDSPCGPSAALAPGTPSMQAFIRRCYGRADVLRYESVARPAPGEGEVLVDVRAAALNPLDWHYLTGTPYVMRLESGLGRPASDRLGVDFAGVVAAVGPGVTRFEPGDAVFGSRWGAFAEYLVVPASRPLLAKPETLSFEQAAAVPVAAVTALQGLRDKGQVQAGDRVLINGASGGVGTFAVQIAKGLGAEVTGVCSTRNVELVRSLGADHVVDYTQEDFTRSGRRYDVVIDNVGNHSMWDVRRVLEPDGIYVRIGGPKHDRWLGPLTGFAQAPLVSLFSSQQFVVLLAQMNEPDLLVLSELMQSGRVTPVIDRRYPFAELPDAIRYLETQRARGKVVITRDGREG